MKALQRHQGGEGMAGPYPPPQAPRPAGGLPYATAKACRRAIGLLLGAALLGGASYAPLPPSFPARPGTALPLPAPTGPRCPDQSAERFGCFAKPPPWAPQHRSVPGERHERLR